MTEDKKINLWKALLTARADMSPVIKDSKNPYHKNDYASLEAVYDCIDKPLHEAGLVVVQSVDILDGEVRVLHTSIVHAESGEWTASTYPLKPVKDSPQDFAGAITYARRYSLVSMFGLRMEDDDGNRATRVFDDEPAPPPKKEPDPTNDQRNERMLGGFLSALNLAKNREDMTRTFRLAREAGIGEKHLKTLENGIIERMTELGIPVKGDK